VERKGFSAAVMTEECSLGAPGAERRTGGTDLDFQTGIADEKMSFDYSLVGCPSSLDSE
jgi:hypothetical protein